MNISTATRTNHAKGVYGIRRSRYVIIPKGCMESIQRRRCFMRASRDAIAERESNRIARRRCIFASFGVLSLARLISCFAKSHQNLSKMHSPAGASSFDAADFFESKSFSRRAYRQYVQEKRCRNRRNLHVKTNLVRLPFGYALCTELVDAHDRAGHVVHATRLAGV